MITALTSLSPAQAGEPRIDASLRSWRDDGADVVAFNHPSEIATLQEHYDVRFVPVTETAAAVFGRHCVPISTMLEWAALQAGPVLLINSDITLELAPWELERIRLLCDDGLGYVLRYNHSGSTDSAVREQFGIDAFVLHGRHAAGLPASFLSMGQPFWDYWLPHAFAARGLPLYSVDFRAAFHLGHPTQWSWDMWHRCAVEFARVAGVAGDVDTFESCLEMSRRVRRGIDAATVRLDRTPRPIEEWVRARFGGPGAKLFLELGAHRGTDTAWMAELPGVTIHAFEPDPRNDQPRRPNVTLHRAAVADRDGPGTLVLSREGWGQEWTHSSSIKQPKNHLRRYPVTFGGSVDIQLVTLDSFHRQARLGVVDFVWADIQGAEGEMVRGGLETLARTRYLYTEYSDDELYEGQATLAEILELLPDFRVLELWPGDVLLENRRLAA